MAAKKQKKEKTEKPKSKTNKRDAYNEEKKKLIKEMNDEAMENAKKKKKTGRPTLYNQEMADLICEKVATHTFGLLKLCKTFPELPDQDTINVWRYKHPSFADQYMRAKAHQAQLLAEESIDIADDGRNDWMECLSDDGQGIAWKLNGEHIARSRLRIDTRKWHASKLAPKIYGDKVVNENHNFNHEQALKDLDDKSDER